LIADWHQKRSLSVFSVLFTIPYLATNARRMTPAVARTDFWLFLFRSQGATTRHTSSRKEVPRRSADRVLDGRRSICAVSGWNHFCPGDQLPFTA